MDNLITNAIKYNKPGGKVDVCGSLADGEVVVAVSDTGVGIPDQYRPFLFSEFFRVKSENGKHPSGTGLGLHIVKKIVSEMGGTVGVESEVNVGSTFRVRLPAWHEQAEKGKE
jgi:two-component system phosphate regulon sensor histidine kinase PhoR